MAINVFAQIRDIIEIEVEFTTKKTAFNNLMAVTGDIKVEESILVKVSNYFKELEQSDSATDIVIMVAVIFVDRFVLEFILASADTKMVVLMDFPLRMASIRLEWGLRTLFSLIQASRYPRE